MYDWRKMTPEQRSAILAQRQVHHRPWHSPPHQQTLGPTEYHITAACYEHMHHIGRSPDRLDSFAEALLACVAGQDVPLHAWCILPNHYHLLVTLPDLKQFVHDLGEVHGRASYEWNAEENARGRKVFHRASDREIRSDAHFWSVVNYIHHNPVRHGYVPKWQEWPWSSAAEYLDTVGTEEAASRWRAYPILDTGEGWDEL